ncbi:MAG: sigma 54-interacting transcriptional regulator [Polyangiaceae bacterium]
MSRDANAPPPSRGAAGTLTTVRADHVELPALRVVVTPRQGAALEAELGVEPLVVGSDAGCDLVVADARVSRRHCELRLGERGIVVRDLGSKNGVQIGGVAMLEGVVPPGVELRIGNSTLAVHAGTALRSVSLSPGNAFGEALGGSVVMRALFARLERAAQTEETILLLGESGTGKELLARAIHERSNRRGGPFVVLDCSAISPGVVESELFGYVKGAFTDAGAGRLGLLEQAHGGTLMIDEIGELPLELQPKLLRALESRTVRRVGANDYRPFDARVVAATHRDLRARLQAGEFRQDLYYRLAVVEALVPALRDRREDIPLLVERFLAAQSPPRAWADLPGNALELLTAHGWPGNVRELRNVVTRLLLFPGSLASFQPSPTGSTSPPLAAIAALGLREAREAVLEHFERAYIAIKLAETSGNVSRAATAMGVSRQFLHRLIDRYGLRGGGDDGGAER